MNHTMSGVVKAVSAIRGYNVLPIARLFGKLDIPLGQGTEAGAVLVITTAVVLIRF